MAKVSVIVPVYNAEEFLPECISSILSQEYSDFQLILVDDGSDDSSGAICEEYSQKDQRISVIHQANKGPGCARNVGIKAAEGDFISFIDSDDTVSSSYLSDFILSEECDFEIQGMTIIEDGNVKEKILPSREITGDVSELYRDASLYNLLRGACCKIFKKSIIEDKSICFPEFVSYQEDEIFVKEYLLYARTTYILPKSNYHYIHRVSPSLTRQFHSGDELYHSFIRINELFLKQQEQSSDIFSEDYYSKHINIATLGFYQMIYNYLIDNTVSSLYISTMISRFDNEIWIRYNDTAELPVRFRFLAIIAPILKNRFCVDIVRRIV